MRYISTHLSQLLPIHIQIWQLINTEEVIFHEKPYSHRYGHRYRRMNRFLWYVELEQQSLCMWYMHAYPLSVDPQVGYYKTEDPYRLTPFSHEVLVVNNSLLSVRLILPLSLQQIFHLFIFPTIKMLPCWWIGRQNGAWSPRQKKSDQKQHSFPRPQTPVLGSARSLFARRKIRNDSETRWSGTQIQLASVQVN